MKKKNVFVIGMNDLNRKRIHDLPGSEECNFHELLTYEESHGAKEYNVKKIMDKATKQLDEFDDEIDAIISFWDFPVSIMQTILAKRYNTIATSTQSIYFCEDKYGARVKQAEVIQECVPGFKGFNPFEEETVKDIDLEYPFWVKPVKSFGSHLGFKIENDADLERAVGKMKERIKNFTDPFFELVEYSDMEFTPDQKILAIAEEIIGGHQCTLEGYVYDGEVVIHGVIDSHTYKGMSSFSHYQYPSVLSDEVKERMTDCTRKIMKHIGFNNSVFNVEFYWDKKTDDIKLLEINPRISQSHAELFKKVDGVYNHKIILDVALGKKPDFPVKEGSYNTAGKFFIRSFKNGIIKKAPGEEEIKKVQEKYPDVILELVAKEGNKLEDLPYQDSYSYKLGFVFLGAESGDEMKEKFEDIKEMLGYKIEEVE
ncbi:MAG TPA: ATP-grasp domain-containing protein [Tangfeifania sp.]|nr:ATP-grasp domain-containing protein [Tangfeifania sp.]